MHKPPEPGFFRDDQPPDRGRVVHIVRIRGNERRTFVVLSKGLQGYYVHWDPRGPKGQHVRCFRDKRKCPGCKHGLSRRWVGFVSVLEKGLQKPVFLELTEYGGEQWYDLLKDRVDSRGMMVMVMRERPANNAPLILHYVGECPPDTNLPVPPDVEETLKRLWGKDVDD